jgi:hypothetical protein
MQDEMPKSVREIADVIGVDQTMRLIAQLPVCRRPDRKTPTVMLYVPKKLPVDHDLVRMIGYQDAMKLVRAFGGEILYPAICRQMAKRVRDDAIVRTVAMGSRYELVADLYSVSVRHVRNLIAGAEIAPEDAEPHAVQIDADPTQGDRHGL